MGFLQEIFEDPKIGAEIREICDSQKSGAIFWRSQKSLRLWVELIEQSALHPWLDTFIREVPLNREIQRHHALG